MAPLAACASWLAVGTSLATVGAEGAQAVAAAPRLALPGPLRSMTHLTRSELLEAPEPVLVHSPPLLKSLEQVGLSSFDQLRKQHGDEELLFGGSDSSDFLSQRRQPVRRYLEHLQDGLRTRLPETGGREFFLARPKLYDKVARAYSRLLPKGFSEMLDVSSWKSQRQLLQAAKDEDFGHSDLVLWLGNRGYNSTLQVDYFTGALFTQLEGRKRMWLYPAAQQHQLPLGQPRSEQEGRGWGSSSDILGNRRIRLLPEANGTTPLVVDLEAGETLLIPCGWARRVEYLTASMSLSCAIHPDWLDKLLQAKPSWSPGGCAAWLREPCGPEGCDWDEL